MSAMVNMFEAKRTCRAWWIAPPRARKSLSPSPASLLRGWCRLKRCAFRANGGGRQIWLAPDWDDPMDEEMLDLFEGKDDPYFEVTCN